MTTIPAHPAPRTLICYPFLPHYRLGVFQALDRSAYTFVFAGDIRTRDNIRGIDPDEVTDYRPLRNVKIGRALWQIGATSQALDKRFDLLVFAGDVATLSTWVAAAAARLQGRSVAFWTIGWHRPERGIKRLIRIAFYRIAHVLLLYGDTGRQIGIECGYPSARMKIIGNSIADTDCCANVPGVVHSMVFRAIG